MTRPQRYALIVVLLAVLVGLGAVVRSILRRDREETNAKELEAIKKADLSQKETRDPAAEAAKSWPQFRGPNRDGWGSDANLNADWNAKPPIKLWETPCGGGYSSLAVLNGRVYTQDRQGNDERVVCLDAASGKLIWEHRDPVDYSGFKLGYAGGPRATPTVNGNRIYTLGATGQLLCLQEGSGNTVSRVWSTDLMAEYRAPLPSWGFASSPLVDGNLVIVQAGGRDGSVVALDKTTGAKKWAAGSDRNGYSSPVIATLGGVRQVVAVSGQSVLGIRLSDGAVLWKKPWKTDHDGNVAMPIVVENYVFVSSNYGKGCGLFHITPADGGLDATTVYFHPNKVMRNHHSTCVHIDGFLYGFDNDQLKCVDLKAGTVVEDWPPPEVSRRLQKGGLIAAGKHLIGLTQTGTLFIGPADPKEFAFTGFLPNTLSGSECWAIPALADGKLYLRDGEKVLCLDVSR